MARPQLPIGTHDEISYHVVKSGSHIARTFYRDADGVTRQVQRTGPTQAAARNNLPSSLQERRHNSGGSGLSADSPFREAADLWLAGVVHAADVGDLSPNTAQLYELQLRNHILPALGSLRLREIRVGRADDFLRRLQRTSGVATTKTRRTVVSGVMGLAVRHEAVQYNPAREVSRIRGSRRKVPRALTRDERDRWLAALDADPQAVHKDLPDLTRWILATERLRAVAWPESRDQRQVRSTAQRASCAMVSRTAVIANSSAGSCPGATSTP